MCCAHTLRSQQPERSLCRLQDQGRGFGGLPQEKKGVNWRLAAPWPFLKKSLSRGGRRPPRTLDQAQVCACECDVEN